MNLRQALATLTLFAASLHLRAAEPARLRFIDPHEKTGSSQAVVVDGLALAHTAQLLPFDAQGKLVGKGDPDAQIQQVLNNLEAALVTARSDFEHAVKINVYVRTAKLTPEVQDALFWRFKNEVRPAVTIVESALPHPDAVVAMDAVAAVPKAGADVQRLRAATLAGNERVNHVAVLPAGPHVYVSGQASPKGNDLAQATRQTLDSLRATLKFLDLHDGQIVQVKAFLRPMTAVAEAEQEIVKSFGDRPVPPLVFVEWQSDLPIEIELVAAAPVPKEKAKEPIEFLTPPGVQASPVFSRVTRINHGKIVYVGGLVGQSDGKPAAQVQEVFASLGDLLKKTGSDVRHLAKGTYYVTDEETTRQFGEFRLKHYDPRRPPAASKAQVPGVGFPGKSLALDMIAVVP
ncbi:MAG: RidA family protein [Planctomycetia bacterium]|nr:RidA family protein [Planctomycetia bacterium]